MRVNVLAYCAIRWYSGLRNRTPVQLLADAHGCSNRDLTAKSGFCRFVVYPQIAVVVKWRITSQAEKTAYPEICWGTPSFVWPM